MNCRYNGFKTERQEHSQDFLLLPLPDGQNKIETHSLKQEFMCRFRFDRSLITESNSLAAIFFKGLEFFFKQRARKSLPLL